MDWANGSFPDWFSIPFISRMGNRVELVLFTILRYFGRIRSVKVEIPEFSKKWGPFRNDVSVFINKVWLNNEAITRDTATSGQISTKYFFWRAAIRFGILDCIPFSPLHISLLYWSSSYLYWEIGMTCFDPLGDLIGYLTAGFLTYPFHQIGVKRARVYVDLLMGGGRDWAVLNSIECAGTAPHTHCEVWTSELMRCPIRTWQVATIFLSSRMNCFSFFSSLFFLPR